MKKKKKNTFKLNFFCKHKLNWFGYHFFRPIQIQIYLGVPILGRCEYIYDYSDWYTKIKIPIWIHSTQNKIYVMNINAIKVCKLIYIGAIIYDLLYWIKNNWRRKNVFYDFLLSKFI